MAEDRPQYQHGTGTIGDTTFHWGSGTPGKYWSVPYGDYPITPDAPTGAWAQRVGAIPIANNVIPDPKLGRDRIGIMIHSGSASSLDALYTQGCFKVAPDEWPDVRKQILAESKKGPLYLHVQPGGVASFTNTKTMEQASIPTVGAPGPPATSTTINAQTTPVAGALAKQAATPNTDAIIDTLSKNIAGIESSGQKNPYGALNPNTHAIGKYQVMPANVPGWTMAATGKSMTPDEFKASPEAQEAVFRDQMRRNLQLYGPKDAASIWFTGKPYNVAGGAVTDANKTTNASYVARATAGLEDSKTFKPSSATASAAPTAPAEEQPWWQKAYGALVDKPKDAQGNPTGKPSPYEQLAETMAKGPERMKALEEAQAPQSVQNYAGTAPAARNISPGLANISQTYGQTLNSIMQPLTWNNAPPRAPQMAASGFQTAPGSQIPGMSLNSFLPPSQGIGYGIDPVGFGYG